jgi:hypothetical protein
MKVCYFFESENRVSFLVECPSEEAALRVVQEQLYIPVASIMVAEEVSVIP